MAEFKLESVKEESGGFRRQFNYKGIHYGEKCLDFDVVVSHCEGDQDGKFKLEGIDFGEDMHGNTVEEVIENLRTRLLRAACVLKGLETETSVPLTFNAQATKLGEGK